MTPTKIVHIVLKREWSTNEAEKEKREKRFFLLQIRRNVVPPDSLAAR